MQRRHSYVKPDYEELSYLVDARGIIPEDFRANVMNRFAEEILHNMKLKNVAKAFEIKKDTQHPVMTTRHCLKYALGHCLKYNNPDATIVSSSKEKWVEPMTLCIGSKKFILKFGCKNDCMSEIFCTFAVQNNKL